MPAAHSHRAGSTAVSGRRPAKGPSRPIGTVTRGTTNPNRLRRGDRWLAGPGAPVLRAVAQPVVVDLGFGASPVTTLELAERLARVSPQVQVVGIEIDPDRVTAAQAMLGSRRAQGTRCPASTPAPSESPTDAQVDTPAGPRLTFRRGGFELPLDGIPGADHGAHVVRAFNVLRQYDVAEVGGAWDLLRARLAPGGMILDGTCDELGRLASWIAVDADGPRSWTMSVHLATLGTPSRVAERLPKALIHENVPGTWIHHVLAELDRCWLTAAPHASWGVRQRWITTCREFATRHRVLDGPNRWRLGELTLPWPGQVHRT